MSLTVFPALVLATKYAITESLDVIGAYYRYNQL
jgi:hypothetical protein